MPKRLSGESMRSANRLLDVLASFDIERPNRTMTEIAQELRLAPSTVRRLLLTLVRHGLLEVDAATSTYSVAPQAAQLVAAATAAKLIRAAQASLDEVAAETGESVILAMLDGTDGVHVDVRHSRHFVAAFNPVGYRIACHLGGAIGKVLLAWLPEGRVTSLLPKEGAWQPPTPRAANSIAAFLADLATVRRRGYATNDRATHDEAWTVAAPIRDDQDLVVAALLIAIPQSRASAATRRNMTSTVVAAAREISLRLAFRPPATDTADASAQPAEVPSTASRRALEASSPATSRR